MSTPSEPPDSDPFPASEPWLLGWLSQRRAEADSIVAAEKELPPKAFDTLFARGLVTRRRDAAADAAIVTAGQMIACVPSLHRVVLGLVRGIALIDSAGPNYDVSHSEPAWPGWIFISIPPSGPSAAVRLAEGVVHEAMHHNLSALEERVPLVSSPNRLYSPWKRERRPASGVLHGVYVFACLVAYFQRLPINDATVDLHVRARVQEIKEEIGAIDRAALNEAMSPAGRRLCQALYRTVAVS